MGIITNFATFISPFFISSIVTDEVELKKVAFGFPFPFVVQDLSGYSPPFPYKMDLSSPWENPTYINFLSLLASLFIINAAFYFLYKWKKGVRG